MITSNNPNFTITSYACVNSNSAARKSKISGQAPLMSNSICQKKQKGNNISYQLKTANLVSFSMPPFLSDEQYDNGNNVDIPVKKRQVAVGAASSRNSKDSPSRT